MNLFPKYYKLKKCDKAEQIADKTSNLRETMRPGASRLLNSLVMSSGPKSELFLLFFLISSIPSRFPLISP